MSVKQVLLYLLAAFLGGVLTIAAFIIALAISAGAGGSLMSVHFGGGSFEFYKQLELIESDIRDGKLYVKYKNVGDKETSTACFKVKVYADEERLIGESDESAYDSTPPGETNENIIESETLSELLADPKNTVQVTLTYGYIE